jgi:hypothetical protein
MSRSYRLKVRETLRKLVRAEDHVSSQLEVLEILPCEQMAELLAKELVSRGFKRQGNTVVREEKGMTVTVELETGDVTVSVTGEQKVRLTAEQVGSYYDETPGGKSAAEKQLREHLAKGMEKDAVKHKEALQKHVTDRLEGELADIKRELDQAVNKATAAALKLKASQIGQIKEMSEDPQTGSLTLVVEV